MSNHFGIESLLGPGGGDYGEIQFIGKPEPIKRVMLVYQAGHANVFEVERFSFKPAQRGRTRRIYQGNFRDAGMICWGLVLAGAEVKIAACNRAGDIEARTWTEDLENQPFSREFWQIDWEKLLAKFRERRG